LNKVIEADTGLYHQWDVILRAKETKVKRFQRKNRSLLRICRFDRYQAGSRPECSQSPVNTSLLRTIRGKIGRWVIEMDEFIKQMVWQKTKATAEALNQVVTHIAGASFATDPLEVDEPLWGSFWQGDVIAPGYTLPAVELALLRAIRLDETWPQDTNIETYLADLRQSIRHPQAGIWSLTILEEACIVFAAPNKEHPPHPKSQIPLTIVWYCPTTGRLHAGYRTTRRRLYFSEAIEQRAPGLANQLSSNEAEQHSDWLESIVEKIDIKLATSLAARLDAEILRWRLDRVNP
jgi:hypothetical protein